MKFYIWPAGRIQNNDLLNFVPLTICCQLFSATLSYQSFLQNTFYLMIQAKNKIFQANVMNLLKKLPAPALIHVY